MRCSFCSTDKVENGQGPFCRTCWEAMERGDIPPVNFREYFFEGLENKLKEVDSLLFNIPENFFLWYIKGHLEHELGSTKKAMNSIKTSISYKEDYGDPWIRLGLIHSDMHREAEAIENFRKGLEYTLMDPSNLVDAGMSLQASDNSELAARILRRALDLVPDDDRTIVGLGKVYFQMGELEDAKEIMDRGLELHPHNEEVLRAMAQIKLKMEDLDSAMEIYSRILDQHPRDFEALLAKGEIHLRKLEFGQSIKAYKAVRDLDIYLSWSGILKFLLSSVRDLFRSNQNTLSYREDLKKEYENIVLYVEKFEDRSGTSLGPETLDEIEKLVRIIESQRLNLNEQLSRFEELLESYKVDDSFHQHLQGKMADMRDFIEQGRYFDAKHITQELSPFLSDLGRMKPRDSEKKKNTLKKKLEELREIGKENKDLSIRLEEVDKLEEEGNKKGAAFMLKEIEISLEEYYMECSHDIHSAKLEEMRSLLTDAKNKFDISGLKEIFRDLKESPDQGIRGILRAYREFQKRFEEDSANYYLDEMRKTLKEIDYKLVILEKDEMDTSILRERYGDLLSEVEGGLPPRKGSDRAKVLMDHIKETEEKHRISQIRERLRGLDKLLGDVDVIGMDDALAKNVEPVRRVIERSLKQNNFRLSEILTKEVYDNVEKLLRDRYFKGIKNRLSETEGEVLRFKGLGITRKDWNASLERAAKIISKKVRGSMTEVVSHLARMNTELKNYYIEKLPKEIDRKLEDVHDLLKEGESYELDLRDSIKRYKKIEGLAEDISTVDILEDSYRLESNIEREIRQQLSEKVISTAEEIRKRAETIDELSPTRRDLLKIISDVNRAEVLIENEQERKAYEKINMSRRLIKEIWEEVLEEMKDIRIRQIDELISISRELDIDISDFEKDRSILSMEKEPDPLSELELAEAIHTDLYQKVKESSKNIYKGIKASFKELMDMTPGSLPEETKLEVREMLKDLKDAVKKEEFEHVPELVSRSIDLREAVMKKAKETSYLEKCSEVLEIGFSLEIDEAKDLVTRAQELAERIKRDETEGIDEEIKELRILASSLRSLQQMEDIGSMLKGIQDMDDLAIDMISNMDEKNPLYDRITGLRSKIISLIDRTSQLHNDPDREMMEKIKDEMSGARMELDELENIWKADRRLEGLEEAGLLEGVPGSELLDQDIDKLKSHYREKDWTKFFRTWERIETKMRKKKKEGELEDIDMERFKPVDMYRDKGIGIITRKRSRHVGGKPETGPKWKKKGGIQELAQNMAEKKKRMEDTMNNVRDGAVDNISPEGLSRSKEKEESHEDLGSIAKIIAVERIEELKKNRSKALEEGTVPDVLWVEGGDPKRKLPDPVLELEDLADLDTSVRRVDLKEDVERARKRLIDFFDKFPDLPQLEEAKEQFLRGEKALEVNDLSKAIGEFHLAISNAIKVGRVHAEMGRHLRTVGKTLSRLKEKGIVDKNAEKLYSEAEDLYKKGDHLGCARKFRSIKRELKRG